MCSTPFIPTQETKIRTRFTIPLDTENLCKESPDAEREKLAKKLDASNRKRLQNIVGNLLYYFISIDATILMEMSSLVVVQEKRTIEAEKQITHLFNYCASHIYTVTEYRKGIIILYIYSDASYISEPEARRRSSGFFSSSQNPSTTH